MNYHTNPGGGFRALPADQGTTAVIITLNNQLVATIEDKGPEMWHAVILDDNTGVSEDFDFIHCTEAHAVLSTICRVAELTHGDV